MKAVKNVTSGTVKNAQENLKAKADITKKKTC